MDCELIVDELVAYHFAALGDEPRAVLEAHLLECASCLRAYVALKRDLELGGDAAPRPSRAARERLRQEVQRTFVAQRPRRIVALAQARVPLLAAVAAAALLAISVWALPRILGPVVTLSSATTIDTSRSVAVSELLY